MFSNSMYHENVWIDQLSGYFWYEICGVCLYSTEDITRPEWIPYCDSLCAEELMGPTPYCWDFDDDDEVLYP